MLVTKKNLIEFCASPRSEAVIYRRLKIKEGEDKVNKRYEQRYLQLKANLMKKGLLIETEEGKIKSVRRNPKTTVSQSSGTPL